MVIKKSMVLGCIQLSADMISYKIYYNYTSEHISICAQLSNTDTNPHSPKKHHQIPARKMLITNHPKHNPIKSIYKRLLTPHPMIPLHQPLKSKSHPPLIRTTPKQTSPPFIPITRSTGATGGITRFFVTAQPCRSREGEIRRVERVLDAVCEIGEEVPVLLVVVDQVGSASFAVSRCARGTWASCGGGGRCGVRGVGVSFVGGRGCSCA